MYFYLQNGEEFRIPIECAYDCTRQGDATQTVKDWILSYNFKWPSIEGMKSELKETGCWQDLDEISEDLLRERFLWIAAGSFTD